MPKSIIVIDSDVQRALVTGRLRASRTEENQEATASYQKSELTLAEAAGF
jgi:hypothetical protein